MVDADFLAHCKPGVRIVNIARGGSRMGEAYLEGCVGRRSTTGVLAPAPLHHRRQQRRRLHSRLTPAFLCCHSPQPCCRRPAGLCCSAGGAGQRAHCSHGAGRAGPRMVGWRASAAQLGGWAAERCSACSKATMPSCTCLASALNKCPPPHPPCRQEHEPVDPQHWLAQHPRWAGQGCCRGHRGGMVWMLGVVHASLAFVSLLACQKIGFVPSATAST